MNEEASTSTLTRSDKLQASFTTYRAELDAHYDRRERIIKVSRDITAQSKKAIFALHRITSRDSQAVFKEAETKMKEVVALFDKVSNEIQGEDFWRYERQISPGIQEYLEALTFQSFLLNSHIPTLSECQTTIPSVHITIDDYLGGLCDLSGELMRLAIAATSTQNEEVRKVGEGLVVVVRGMKIEIEPLEAHARWLSKKLTVLDQSLSKMEAASYARIIRRAEFPHEQNAPLRLPEETPIVSVEG